MKNGSDEELTLNNKQSSANTAATDGQNLAEFDIEVIICSEILLNFSIRIGFPFFTHYSLYSIQLLSIGSIWTIQVLVREHLSKGKSNTKNTKCKKLLKMYTITECLIWSIPRKVPWLLKMRKLRRKLKLSNLLIPYHSIHVTGYFYFAFASLHII